MGSISMSEDETVELIYSLMEVGSDSISLVELSSTRSQCRMICVCTLEYFWKEWPMSEYDILNKNCCHFCEDAALCRVFVADAFSISYLICVMRLQPHYSRTIAVIICYHLLRSMFDGRNSAYRQALGRCPAEPGRPPPTGRPLDVWRLPPSEVKKLAGLGATLNESAQVAVDQVFQAGEKNV